MTKKESKEKGSFFESDIFADLSKDYGLALYSDSDYGVIKDRLPTLIPSIDATLNGGLPLSRLTELFGSESVGKSVSCMAFTRGAQVLGMIPIVFDVEGTTNRKRLSEVSVDPNKVMLKQPKGGGAMTVEEITSTMISLVEKIGKEYPDHPLMLIWDSIAATQSAMENDAEIGESRVGALAHSLSVTFRKLMPVLSAYNACLLCTNQARDEIGGNPYLATVATVGGRAFKHNTTYRVYIKKGQKIKARADDKVGIGHEVKMTLTKAKDSNAGQTGVGYLAYEDGFGYEFNIYNLYKENKLFGGSAQFPAYVDSNGEEHKMRGNDWVPFLKSPEGNLCRKEMWQELIKLYFPKGYPPLYNETVPLKAENFPDCEGLREYYDSL